MYIVKGCGVHQSSNGFANAPACTGDKCGLIFEFHGILPRRSKPRQWFWIFGGMVFSMNSVMVV